MEEKYKDMILIFLILAIFFFMVLYFLIHSPNTYVTHTELLMAFSGMTAQFGLLFSLLWRRISKLEDKIELLTKEVNRISGYLKGLKNRKP